MKKIFTVIAFLISFKGTTQFIKERALDFSVGIGASSSTYDSENSIDPSIFIQGEYAFIISEYLDLRPYAGIILTRTDGKDFDGNPTIYSSTTNAFVTGGKTRLTIPIPLTSWASIYMEAGIGASWGRFENYTPNGEVHKSGVIMHIPGTMGFIFGTRRKFNFASTFYFHNTVKQTSFAVNFGMNFPID